VTLRAVTAVFLVAFLAPIASAQGTSPRATLLQQATQMKQAKWRAMYATYTPRFRRACPYSRFVQASRQTRTILGTNFQIRGIQVRIETPRRAIVAYTFVGNGQAIARVTFRHRDVYVKSGSRWYDELDRVSAC
jgi:hypothetical protein